MFGGFLKGVVGWALQAISGIGFLVLIGSGTPIGTAILITGVVFVFGAYLAYVSRNTVRTKR